MTTKQQDERKQDPETAAAAPAETARSESGKKPALHPARASKDFLSDEKEKRERRRDAETVRIKLIRSIIVDGVVEESGSFHVVPRALAHRLVGEGSALRDPEDADDNPNPPVVEHNTQANRMEPADSRDPDTSRQTNRKPPTVTRS
jgi:hypothetical protein